MDIVLRQNVQDANWTDLASSGPIIIIIIIVMGLKQEAKWIEPGQGRRWSWVLTINRLRLQVDWISSG